MNVIANSNIMKNNSKLNIPHSSDIEKFEAWNREAEERAVMVKDKQEQKWENERSPYFQFRHNIN